MSSYSVKQSDRNSWKTDIFQRPINLWTSRLNKFCAKISFARHEYGQVEVFRIKMRALVQKLQLLEKCKFSNYSHLIASHFISLFKFVIHERPHEDWGLKQREEFWTQGRSVGRGWSGTCRPPPSRWFRGSGRPPWLFISLVFVKFALF